MALDREPIFAALKARLSAALSSTFPTIVRGWRGWNQLDDTELPALYVSEGSQIPQVQLGRPPKYALTAILTIYCRRDEADETATIQTQLNALILAAETAMERRAAEQVINMNDLYATNLGIANVIEARVSSVTTDEGMLGPLAMAVLEVNIVAATT